MKGSRLDLCLSKGYYRTQQDIFTCRFVQFDGAVYPVHWLRIVLANVTLGPSQRRLLRSNGTFSAVVKPFVLTSELEGLYRQYRHAIDFDAPDSVEACLLGGAMTNAFDTYVLEIRDEGRLIAAGIFDNGARSLAGIMNVYHPDYRKRSLGKYLMLLKMEYGQQHHKTYYYPGYLVGYYPKFDYKLFASPAATEVYDDDRDTWLPFSWEGVNARSAGMMHAYVTGYEAG